MSDGDGGRDINVDLKDFSGLSQGETRENSYSAQDSV